MRQLAECWYAFTGVGWDNQGRYEVLYITETGEVERAGENLRLLAAIELRDALTIGAGGTWAREYTAVYRVD